VLQVPLDAQQAGNAFSEVFEVRVTNVDVVATDSKGNPIPGLTQNDFEIYEDGRPQEITNFSMITGAQAAGQNVAGQPGGAPLLHGPTTRKFIVYLDGNSLGLKNRTDIVSATTDFLKTNLRPGDQAMIASWSNGSLNINLPWSSDPKAIETVLKPLAGEAANAGRLQTEKQSALRTLRTFEKQVELKERDQQCDPSNFVTYETVEAQVRSYAEQLRHDIAQSVTAMSRLLSSLSGVEGRKIMVLATEELPTQAGAEVFNAMESLRQRAIAKPEVVATDASGSPGIGTSLWEGARHSTVVGEMSKYNLSSLIDSLGRAANASGVAVYSINPKGTDNSAGTADLQEASELSASFAQSAQTLDGVNMLANKTGGVAMIGAPAAEALARLANDLGTYYSIGYHARPGKAAERKIEVKIRKPGVTSRYRKSIYYRTLDTEMTDHVLANHLQTDLPNDMGINLQVDPVTVDGGKKLMPMRVIIPADSLTLIPDAEGNLTGGFSVFTSTGDKNGGSGVNVQSQQIKWPPAQAIQMKGRRIGFAVQVPMDKDPKQISVGVVDHVSQVQGFSVVKVAAN
jgi:VWFA-related protein